MHPTALVSVVLGMAATSAAQVTVLSVDPPRNAVTASSNPRILMRFGQALAPASVTATSFRVFGRWSGARPGTLRLENGNQDIVFEPDAPFFPGEWISVSASSAITSAGGSALTGGHAFGFWIRTAPGSFQFTNTATISTRIAGDSTVRTYGGYAGDIDRDGAPDLSLTNEDVSDVRVFHNDGCDGFVTTPVVHPLAGGSVPSPAEGADFNGDGWTDLAIGCHGSGEVAVLLSDGLGGFTPPVAYAAGTDTRGIAVLDAEGDGDDDVIAADSSASQLTLHLNNGDGTFAAAAPFDGGLQERAVAAADADNDGWIDLFVADFSGAIHLLLSDGAGGYQQSATVAVPNTPWMIVSGDVDNDGNADAVAVNSMSWTASVVLGDGLGGLSAPLNFSVGSFPIAVDLGDLDGDGILDLTVSNYVSADFTVYKGSGLGTFIWQTSLPTAQAGSCTLLADHDRDGRLDILGIDELEDCIHVFTQTPPLAPGVQGPRCDATLRVDNFAALSGFAGSAPWEVPLAGSLFFDVQGTPGAQYAVLLGGRLEPGANLPFGVLNLGGVVSTLIPSGTLDVLGQDRVHVTVPPTVTAASRFAFQAVVLEATPFQLSLSNPAQIVIVP